MPSSSECRALALRRASPSASSPRSTSAPLGNTSSSSRVHGSAQQLEGAGRDADQLLGARLATAAAASGPKVRLAEEWPNAVAVVLREPILRRCLGQRFVERHRRAI